MTELFCREIDRPIPAVIHVDADSGIADEIDEYVATDHIRDQMEAVLEEYQETIQNPNERTNVWVSGFFGSGKSSFAKMLGYLAENPAINGKTALDRFTERVDAPRIEALLNVAHAQAPALSVFLDMSTARNVAKEGESIVLPLYRALLERLGYSRNLLLAELEFDLEGDGDLAAFEEAFQQVAKGNRTWKERRDVGFAKAEASHALHILRPDKYPTSDSWAKQVEGIEVTANWFAERALRLLDRRGGGCKRLVFIVDEVGQYVARSISRMLDLKTIAEAMGRCRGALWFVVTSQDQLQVDGERDDLALVQDRFPIQVDLRASDIAQVICRRLLEKTAAGRDELRAQLVSNRGELLANIRLNSAKLGMTPSDEAILQFYPLVPYQVQLLIDAVSVRRSRADSPILGFHGTIIQIAQQLVMNPSVGIGERPLGDLVTLESAYDLLEGIVPTTWKREVQQVATAYGDDSTETRVIKVVALCSDIGALPLTAENIAVMLHRAIVADSILPAVRNALAHLVRNDRIRLGDTGYQLNPIE